MVAYSDYGLSICCFQNISTTAHCAALVLVLGAPFDTRRFLLVLGAPFDMRRFLLVLGAPFDACQLHGAARRFLLVLGAPFDVLRGASDWCVGAPFDTRRSRCVAGFRLHSRHCKQRYR